MCAENLKPVTGSTKGFKSFEIGAVGLAIVAALENPSEIPAYNALFSRNLSRSNPISINSQKNDSTRRRIHEEEKESESFDDRTNNYYSKVYYSDVVPVRIQNSRPSIFHVSSVICVEENRAPDTDFLSACNSCRKKLHGKDIYMYRGEKAFCSSDCRHKQIAIDDGKEKCRSEASSRSVDISSSSYTNNAQIFDNGIFAI